MAAPGSFVIPTPIILSRKGRVGQYGGDIPNRYYSKAYQSYLERNRWDVNAEATNRVQHGNYVRRGKRGRRPIMSLHGDGQRSELELCIVDSRSDANEDKHRRFDGL